MKRVKHILDKMLEWIVIVVMAVLVLDVTWQVLTRFGSKVPVVNLILRKPSYWTEELATFLMMWVGLLGSALALNRGAHLGVDFVTTKLPEKVRAGVEIVTFALISLFGLLVMMGGGIQLVYRTLSTDQHSPALGLKMGYVYLCLPVSGFFIVLYATVFLVQRIIAVISDGDGGAPAVVPGGGEPMNTGD